MVLFQEGLGSFNHDSSWGQEHVNPWRARARALHCTGTRRLSCCGAELGLTEPYKHCSALALPTLLRAVPSACQCPALGHTGHVTVAVRCLLFWGGRCRWVGCARARPTQWPVPRTGGCYQRSPRHLQDVSLPSQGTDEEGGCKPGGGRRARCGLSAPPAFAASSPALGGAADSRARDRASPKPGEGTCVPMSKTSVTAEQPMTRAPRKGQHACAEGVLLPQLPAGPAWPGAAGSSRPC